MLEATGERLVPGLQHGELVHAEHLARYRLAARLAPGRRVLDAASGEGYGSAMLAAAGAASVVGVDISGEAVAHAREAYGLDFREGDVQALPLEDASVDLVVSFETIEHVRDPERVLAEFRRVLAPDGLVVVSTPNKHEYLVENEFHMREFTHEEFLALLRETFSEVRAVYQQNFLTSAVLDADRLGLDDGTSPLRLDATKVAGSEPGRELYTVALCGHELPVLEADVAVLSGVYEAHRLAAHTAEMLRLVGEWEARATEAERLVGEWEARGTEAERQAAELRGTLERIRGSLSWRLTRPLRHWNRRGS